MASALHSLPAAWQHQQQQLQHQHRNPPHQQLQPDHRHLQHHHHHHHQDLICLQGPTAITTPSDRLDLAAGNPSLAASGRGSKFGTAGMIRMAPAPMRVHEERASMTNRPPEKKQRTPSAYNQFIREEIQRIKANNPEISHREAFSTAAKNWAHFPHIQFGRMLENNNQSRLIGEGSDKKLMPKAAIYND